MEKVIKKNYERGITLIALVITIIILLILAAVTIAALSGDNGILSNAAKAKEETERSQVIEQAQIDILGKQADNSSGELARNDIKEVLDKYFKEVPDDFKSDTVLETIEDYGKHEIAVSEIYSGEIEKPQEVIETTTSYVGYYADVDGNKQPDGIIYVDLADTEHTSGRWNNDDWSDYEYTPVTEGLKQYEVCNESYTGFGNQWTKPVLTAIEGSEEADRFYVMALEDFNDANGPYYCWYDDAYGNLDNPLENETVNDFGQGKQNTIDMIASWNGTVYGAQNDNSKYKDMWGVIQTAVGNISAPTWFVPSKSEWAAFGDFAYTKMGVDMENYANYGLSGRYWSSSQRNTRSAYDAYFDSGCIGGNYVYGNYCVRLSATF